MIHETINIMVWTNENKVIKKKIVNKQNHIYLINYEYYTVLATSTIP
jgi:hypothetical protein